MYKLINIHWYFIKIKILKTTITMRKLFILLVVIALFSLPTLDLKAQTFPIGHRSINFKDASRSGGFAISGGTTVPTGGTGRDIGTEIYYPAVSAGDNTALATGKFPVIVFGHGFVMTWDVYSPFYDSLARLGYIVALPRTEGSLSPTHTEFGKDLAFVLDWVMRLDTVSTSPFFGKVAQKGAIAGHSMGGGSTFLADQYNSRATCYLTMAPAITNPSSALAARAITKPMCILSGTRDCVAGYAGHQKPMYDSLKVSVCKHLVSITDARHCSFSNGGSTNCNFGEGTSGCAAVTNGFTTAMQQDVTRRIMIPYFNYFLKGICSEWSVFENYLATTARLSTQSVCNMSVPSNATISGNNQFCSGSSTTLTASPASFTYAWSNGTNQQTNTVNSAGNYTVSVSNPYCSISSNPFSVSMLSVPAQPAAISGVSQICSNTQGVSYSSSSSDSLVWSLPNGWTTSSSNSSSVTVNHNGQPGTISVSALNQCGNSTASTKAISIKASPASLSAIQGDTLICITQQGIVYSTSSSQDSIVWTLPSGWSTTSTPTNTATINHNGQSGILSVAALNECGTSPSTILNITVVDTPTTSISASGLTISSSTTASSYEWFLNGVSIGTNSPTLTAQVTGSYSLKITDSNGCSGWSNVLFVEVVGINDLHESELMIYPNPTTDKLRILNGIKGQNWTLNSVLGQVLKVGILSSKEDHIDLSGLTNGIYMLSISGQTFKIEKR